MRPPSKQQTFWLLMAAAAITMWLPPKWLADPLRNVFDPVLAPMSNWLYAGGQGARGAVSRWTGGSSDGRSAAELEQTLDASQKELLHFRLENEELLRQLSEATRVPKELLGPRGRLVPANVLARDAVGWREAVLIDAGRNVKIEPKLWVSGSVRTFIDRGTDSDLAPDQLAILPLSDPVARQIVSQSVLVGRIEVVGQVTARVKLLTDPDSHVEVLIYDPARNPGRDPAKERIGLSCVLDGAGPGRLRVKAVAPPQTRPGTHNTDDPPVKVGDLVLTAPDAPNLPLQLLIGQVSEVRRSEANPVEYSLQVTPAVDYAILPRVFVLDPTGGQPARTHGGGR